MKITIEVEIPEKANWMATDESGTTFWYAEEPSPGVDFWHLNDNPDATSSFGFIADHVIVPDWRKSLRRIDK